MGRRMAAQFPITPPAEVSHRLRWMRYLIWVAILFVCISSWAQSPADAPQFDVASIRPVAKDATGNDQLSQLLREAYRNHRHPGEIPMASPDRILLKDWTLLDLIAAAYSVPPTQILGPDWISGQGFDIEATVPVDTPKAALNGMLQSLLEERFGLKAHRTPKTGRGFALIVARDGPRLTPAAPPSPSPAQPLTKEDSKAQVTKNLEAMTKSMRERRERSGNPGSMHFETWPSVTTEELAARLVRYAEAPVVDTTGLTGKYSVTIEVSNNDDEPGNTIFDAVEKLGLKLEPRKVTIEAVVVDQVSKSPTPN